MTRRIPTLKTLTNLANEVREALDNEEFDIVASLLWDVAFKAILLALRRQGYPFRRTWPNMKPLVPGLMPPLSADYTKVLEQAKTLDKDARYAEDDWACNDDEIRELAERVLELVNEVCKMAP